MVNWWLGGHTIIMVEEVGMVGVWLVLGARVGVVDKGVEVNNVVLFLQDIEESLFDLLDIRRTRL